MADECDIASEHEQKWLEAQISEHQYRLSHAVSAYPVGECRNCASRIDDGSAFCDTDCMRDWSDRQRADRRNGKYRGG